MTFELKPLPYEVGALAPVISAETVGYHYGKHHRGYVNTLNELTKGTPFENDSLEQLIKFTCLDPKHKHLFEAAAQVWNHDFYWQCMSPDGGGDPTGDALLAINGNFSSFAVFKETFSKAAAQVFGSGWAWAAASKGGLEVFTTSDAFNPMLTGRVALLTLDVWEHAYYIDYRHKRDEYIKQFWKLVNWDFFAEQLHAA